MGCQLNMVRMLALTALIAVVCSDVRADELVLKDGRTFTGIVTIKDDVVLIEMSYGTLSFSRQQLLRIDVKDTPEQEFDKRLAKLPANDANALYILAKWARDNSLNQKADDLYRRVLKVEPDHAQARKALGQIRIDGQWREFDQALELARGKLEAGRYDQLLKEILPELEEMASREKASLVREVVGLSELRARKFTQAGRTFSELSRKVSGARAIRFAAIAELLNQNADGMYVVNEPYPPESVFNDLPGAVAVGPASLARPLVLEAALRDRAKVDIKAGRELMEAATKLESTDPDAAVGKYVQAGKAYDNADAIVDGIAHSWRVEIARRRINSMRTIADADAKKFDAALASLGGRDLSPQAYRTLVMRLMRNLDSIRDGLKATLDIAKPYPRELVLEVNWAQQDLRKIEAMRDILATELNAKE